MKASSANSCLRKKDFSWGLVGESGANTPDATSQLRASLRPKHDSNVNMDRFENLQPITTGLSAKAFRSSPHNFNSSRELMAEDTGGSGISISISLMNSRVDLLDVYRNPATLPSRA